MIAKLGEVCTFYSGTGFPNAYQGNTDGLFPFYKVGDISKNVIAGYRYLELCGNYIDLDVVRKIKGTIIPSGTVVFAKIGEALRLNRRAITTCECLVDNNVMGLHPNTKYLSVDYFFYWMSNLDLQNYCEATTVPSIRKNRIAEIEIPVPSMAAQAQIVTILNHVTELIANQQKQINKLDELVKSRFIELFGDLADPMCSHPQCRLVEACAVPDDIKCGPFGTQLSKDEYQESGVAVWEIPHINSGFTIQPTHFLTPKKAKELGAYTLEPGDIAMSRKGNVGKCGLYPAGYEIGIIHSDVLRIRVDHQRVHPCFMMHQLHYSGAIQRQIEMVSSGAIMAGINVTKLKQIMVHIPDYGLQHEFVTFVEQTDKLKQEVKNSLEKLETLKKSLMHEYFG